MCTCVLCEDVSSTKFVWTISHSKNNWTRYGQKCILVFMRSTPLFFSKFIETRNFATDFFEEYSKIKFHENTKKSNFMETLKNQISWKYQKSNFMKILKNQISWKYSKIKFHENTQKSNSMKILKNQISWKYSKIKFHENTQKSNFMKTCPQWEPCCSMLTDGQTDERSDRHDEANRLFSRFCVSS